MKNEKHFHGHIMRGIPKLVRELPPLNGRKSPGLAIIAGLFGAIGIGLYFQSRRDFLWSFGICFVGLILSPVTGGAAALLAAIICCYYAYQRAVSSNSALDARGKGPIIIEAEVITKPFPNFVKNISPVPPIIGPAKISAQSVSESLRTIDQLLAERQMTYAEYEEARREILRRI